VFDVGAAKHFDWMPGPLYCRFVDLRDPVPTIPLVSGLDVYRHCGTEMLLPTTWAEWFSARGCLLRRLYRRAVYGYEESLRLDVGAHSIDTYIANLEASAEALTG
jgi:hypothetical protein